MKSVKLTIPTAKAWISALLLVFALILSACDLTNKPLPPATEAATSAQAPALTAEPTAESDTMPSEPSDSTIPESESATQGQPQETPAETCPHTPTPIPAVEPTCTGMGYREGSVCGDCGTVLTPPEEIPPTGHAYEASLSWQCASCGEQAVCPLPVLSVSGELSIPWGDTLRLSWSLENEPLFPVVYTVMDESADPPAPLWDGWREDTSFEMTCRADGGTYLLRVYACYAVNGEPVIATQSPSAAVSVTVPIREALESPAFLFGNAITTDPGKDLTIAWSPVTAETASVRYIPRVTAPDGTSVEPEPTNETLLTLPADLLTAEGEYVLSLIACDETETYRDSEAARLVIRVRKPVQAGEQDFTDPARYASDHYYEYLATQPNGENLRRFYRLVDTALTSFHSSDATAQTIKVSGGNFHYYAAKLDYTICGLTLDEAVSVRFMYVYDHPLYYWISNVYVYSDKVLYFCVFPEYAKGQDRQAYNAYVYQGAEALSEGISSDNTAYETALAFYERVLALGDYAYEDDGETPQDDQWAHSVIGLFDPAYNKVVCEGFAEAYSLLLNYHGVTCISIPGVSRGVGHLWNLVQLDDGEWYWCDITWDDRTYSPLGTDYKYFCVNDTRDVMFYYVGDGIESGGSYTFSGSATFMEDHTVAWDPGITMDMSGAIPARSATPYEGDELILRESFTLDGMTYALTGYGTVQLTDVGSRRSITVPETVTYNGVTYAVTSIGLMNGEGVYMTGRLLPLFTTSVYISKNVSYIWDNALSGILVNITVDPENPYYTVENGILKKK